MLSMLCIYIRFFFFFKQKTAYEMRISDWSSDVCSSDLVAPTTRAAQFRFTFPESDDSHILLDGLAGGPMVKVDVKNRRITGYVRNNHGAVPDHFHTYFVAEFDRDFTLARPWADRQSTRLNSSHLCPTRMPSSDVQQNT